MGRDRMDTQSTEPADWLVQTKLHPPLLREDVIARPRLVAALYHGLTTCPLTLLSAPAGYGKTTLLASLRQGYRLRLVGSSRTTLPRRYDVPVSQPAYQRVSAG